MLVQAFSSLANLPSAVGNGFSSYHCRFVAAVPLGADVVDVAQETLVDHLDRVIVQDVVMSLVAGGEDLARFLGVRAISLHS